MRTYELKLRRRGKTTLAMKVSAHHYCTISIRILVVFCFTNLGLGFVRLRRRGDSGDVEICELTSDH